MGGRQAALGGRAGGGVPESGGGIGCHLGQSREASHTPPPSRLQPGWQLPGAEEEREVVLGILDGLSSTLDTTVRLGGRGGRCMVSLGERRLKRGVSLIQVLA